MVQRLYMLVTLLCLSLTGYSQAVNTLSTREKSEGWQLLFNGKDLAGWHMYGSKQPGTAWKVESGAIKLDVPERAGNKAKDGGDIVTDLLVKGDFEMKVEWKISKYGNSGIFFFVNEEPQYTKMHNTGLELQVIDDNIYQGAKENTHRASDFFGIANARIRESNPVGTWNQVHIIVKNNKLTVLHNGFMVQEHNLLGEDWKKKIAESGLKNTPLAKGVLKGRIGLQDWGSTVWYRNIKIRML